MHLWKAHAVATPRRRRAAFTLIELLMALAVVVMLAGLLLPALGRGKARAQTLVCLGHLKQWGLATHLYAGDNDDFLPFPDGNPNPTEASTNVGWYVLLPREMNLPRYHDLPWRTNATVGPGRTVWLCPANRRRSNGRNLFHYCLNQHVNGTGDRARPVRMAALDNPAAVVWLFDSKNLPAVGYWGYVATNLHQGGAQFGFLDGHVRRFPESAYWDYTIDKGRTDHPGLVWQPNPQP